MKSIKETAGKLDIKKEVISLLCGPRDHFMDGSHPGRMDTETPLSTLPCITHLGDMYAD